MLKSLILAALTVICSVNCVSVSEKVLVFNTINDKEEWKRLHKEAKIIYEDKNILQVQLK